MCLIRPDQHMVSLGLVAMRPGLAHTSVSDLLTPYMRQLGPSQRAQSFSIRGSGTAHLFTLCRHLFTHHGGRG